MKGHRSKPKTVLVLEGSASDRACVQNATARRAIEMPSPIRILLLEDSEDDALLVEGALRDAGTNAECTRVDSEREYIEALDSRPDLILADHNLPHFDSIGALNHLLNKQLDIPFIIVSGSIGEETAVAAMRAGARDYVSKENLARLGPVVERELGEAALRAERRHALDGLRESAERFRRLAENSPDVVYRYTVAPTRRFEYVSPTVSAITGYAPGEFYADPEIGKRLAVESPKSSSKVIGGSPLASVSGQWLTKDGRLIWVEERNSLVRDEAGRVVAIEGIVRDITDRKQAQESEIRARAAEEASNFKTYFLSVVSHELRNPIAAILGFCSTLIEYHDHFGREEVLSYLRGIESSCGSLGAMVDDLLLVSRAEAGRLTLSRRDLKLADFLYEAAKAHRLKDESHPLSVKSADLSLNADESRLRQVIDNLVNNAMKYTSPGSPIEVMGEYKDGEAVVTVRDYGPGVPVDELERIFEAFHRVSSISAVQGSGLGLAVCNWIIRTHGGRIWASLPEGGGLAVGFALPGVLIGPAPVRRSP